MRSLLLGTLLVGLLGLSACASVDVVRLQPDLLRTPRGTEPLAGIQAVCMGFYLFTLGIPEADLDKAVNELLFKEARRLGADRLMNLRFEATPSGGIWWLTKLLGFRFASASAIALVTRPEGDVGSPSGPAPIPPPPPPPSATGRANPTTPDGEAAAPAVQE